MVNDLLPTKLIFVYNADSGVFNALLDWAHKIVSPQTYACNLCVLTYSNLGMRKAWKRFIHNLEMPVEFLHRDEFTTKYGLDPIDLPAAFALTERGVDIWVSATELNDCDTLFDLQNLVNKKFVSTRSMEKEM